MNYKVRPGVVLIRICGVDILTGTREVWESCPKIRPLPRMWAACVFFMLKGRTSEETVAAFSRMLKKTPEDTHKMFDKALEKLDADGFLIPVEDEDDPE